MLERFWFLGRIGKYGGGWLWGRLIKVRKKSKFVGMRDVK